MVYNLFMYTDLKERAIDLRLKGNTYSDINKKVKRAIPKGTLSEWFKHLHFTKAQKHLLQQNVDIKLIKAQHKAHLINKRRQIKYLRGLRDKNLHLMSFLNTDVQKLLLCILYLGEGAKTKSTKHLSLGSSSSKIIQLYMSLLSKCFSIDRSKFRIRIQCRADQDIKNLERYWHRITNIPRKQFYPTYVDKRTINKPTIKKDYKGVCALMYFDRSIQFELEFLAESVIKYLTMGR